MVDLAIIGGGIMGASVALAAILEHQAEVVLLEAGGLPCQDAPSFGDTRLYRMAYFESPEYVPLLKLARKYWNHDAQGSASPWSQLRAPKLFEPTGALYVGRPDSGLISGAAAASKLDGVPTSTLDANALQEFCPAFRFDELESGILDHLGGFVYAGRALSWMLQTAAGHGATLCPHELVLHVEASDREVRIVTENQTVQARRTVICAGLGLSGLTINGQTIPTRLTRQVLTYWQPAEIANFEIGRLLPFAFEEPDGRFFYGVPLNSESAGVKIALHNEGSVVSPPLDYTTTRADQEEIQDFVSRRLTCGAEFVGSKVCHYEQVLDTDLLIGLLPGHENLGIVASTAGHGFKFGPAVGKAMADLLLDGDPSLIPARIDARRLGGRI